MSDLPKTFVPGFHDEGKVRKMKYNQLGNTDIFVSHLSIGIAGFSYFYGNYNIDECKATLLEALKSGINYIDAGPWYGHGAAEQVLGKCLEGVPRQAYYLATKVGRYEKEPEKMFDFSPNRTRESIEESLIRIKVDYFDVIQIHDVEFAPSIQYLITETLPVLRECVQNGKARYIGITGYALKPLVDFIQREEINVILSYSRFTLFDQTLKDFLPLFSSKKLGIINASPTGMGLLTNNGAQNWHPATSDLKRICAEAANYCKENDMELARLAFYYAFAQKSIHSVLCSVNNRELLESNLEVLFNGLTLAELKAMEYLQKNIFSKIIKPHWDGIELERREDQLRQP